MYYNIMWDYICILEYSKVVKSNNGAWMCDANIAHMPYLSGV